MARRGSSYPFCTIGMIVIVVVFLQLLLLIIDVFLYVQLDENMISRETVLSFAKFRPWCEVAIATVATIHLIQQLSFSKKRRLISISYRVKEVDLHKFRVYYCYVVYPLISFYTVLAVVDLLKLNLF